MAKTASIGWAVLMTVVTAAPAARAQGAAAGLASRLDLTETGAGRWLEALGVAPGRPAAETLLVVSSNGEVEASRTGTESAVSFGLEVDTRLLTAGAAVVLVHNHPHGASLSRDDLLQLSKPGVFAVVAIGHDGGMFIATRGKRYDAERFEDLQYVPVRASVTTRLRVECGSGAIAQAAADTHFSHVVALALGRAGVIDYRAVLAPPARASFEAARMAFMRVAAGAARR